MPLTALLSTVTIQGTYVDVTGTPVAGTIRFTPTTIVKDEVNNQIIINKPIVATLNASGFFSVVLPVTDDTDVLPIPFAYFVEEIFTGGRTFYITLPLGTSSPIDIADIAPAVDSVTAALYVTSAQYNSLYSRYTTDNSVLTSLSSARTNSVTATSNATAAAVNVADITARVLSPFLLMGL